MDDEAPAFPPEPRRSLRTDPSNLLDRLTKIKRELRANVLVPPVERHVSVHTSKMKSAELL